MAVSTLLRCGLLLGAAVAGGSALAADPSNGARLAEMRCAGCHQIAPGQITPGQSRAVSEAPPFETIAQKYGSNPAMLAAAILDPHPRMNVTLTRREAEDIAAFIATVAK